MLPQMTFDGDRGPLPGERCRKSVLGVGDATMATIGVHCSYLNQPERLELARTQCRIASY